MNTNEHKFRTVIDNNTFYFFNKEFEERYEGHIVALKNTLLAVQNAIAKHGLRCEIFEDLLAQKEHGLRALLALTGVSNENLKRLTTIIRATDDVELGGLVYKNEWAEEADADDLHEWSDAKIAQLISDNAHFRKGIVRLFFEGAGNPFLARTLPLFELKKFSMEKLRFDPAEMVDTIVRYKEKGSYSGRAENNPEHLIRRILDHIGVPFVGGDLAALTAAASDQKRQMDFIIPDAEKPVIIIECSFLATTSSGQGDKAKTEIAIGGLIKSHHPKAKFIGFVDGIGWFVRRSDLMRMVGAYDDVFTFHPDELARFEKFISATMA